jgi:hypothetical protein
MPKFADISQKSVFLCSNSGHSKYKPIFCFYYNQLMHNYISQQYFGTTAETWAKYDGEQGSRVTSVEGVVMNFVRQMT